MHSPALVEWILSNRHPGQHKTKKARRISPGKSCTKQLEQY